MKPKSQSPKLYSPERENRVAEALRENLHKRKAHQQARAAAKQRDQSCQ